MSFLHILRIFYKIGDKFSEMTHVFPIRTRIALPCSNFFVMVFVESHVDYSLLRESSFSYFITFKLLMTEAVVFLWFIMIGGVPVLGESKFIATSGLRKNKNFYAEFSISFGRAIVFPA